MGEYENSWYNKYSNNLLSDILSDNDIQKYVNLIKNIQTDNSIQVKVNQIEKEYKEKLKEFEELCLDENQIKKQCTYNSLFILQKELDLIKLLTKYSLQNNELNYDFFVNCLKLLLRFSETLRNRINQKEISLEKKIYVDDNISRCSYKFCNYKDSCTYNYNKSKNLCYQDHYVHNMVSADIRVLLDYIDQKYGQTKIVSHNKEILKTINTLSFVINHMESELKAKCLYIVNQNKLEYSSDNELEQYHFIKIK